MKQLIEFVTQCKKKCVEILSALDDSCNYETAVESFMKDCEQSSCSNEPQSFNPTINSSDSLYINPNLNNDRMEDIFNTNNEIDSHDQNKDKETTMDESVTSSSVISKSLNVDNVNDVIEEQMSNKETLQNESREVLLLLSIVGLIEELDTILAQHNDQNILSVLNFSQDRLFEILTENGCSKFDTDAKFDCARHTTRPLKFIPKDTPIKEYLRSGILFHEKVLLKALVKV